jgi:membrane fusion protein, multidrug efflux system
MEWPDFDVGNIIHASSSRGDPTEPNALVVINQVQPISVMVALAASGMPEVREALAKGPVKAIALSADGKTELDTGTVGAIDNQANTTSGTITLKAIFPNTHRTLWPGMFVNVRVITRVQDDGLTVPLDAIQQGPQGQYVFVVDADHKVAMRPVSVTETLNSEALIDKGLRAGETIVVRGQYRLQPGTVVSLANPNDPTAVPNPTPAGAGHEHLGDVHPQADRYRAADDCDLVPRADQLRVVAGGGAPEHRYADGPGHRAIPRRRCPDRWQHRHDAA